MCVGDSCLYHTTFTLAPGYTASPELASELQEHVKKVTAPYKYPREVEFVESLPKTISGKIRRVSPPLPLTDEIMKD
jgi:acyl-coenzyme A synthetase/AMP-(fatty) acid ligase